MSDLVLRLTSFPAGINIYTGTMQGGHTYARIELPDHSRVELERVVDEEYRQALLDLDPTDNTYQVGDTTVRLTGDEEAYQLAAAWMRTEKPGSRLVDDEYRLSGGRSGRVLYEPDQPAPATPVTV